LVIAAIAVALTGCRLDTRVEVQANRDGSGMVIVTATADADLVKRSPNAIIEFTTTDAVAAGWATDGVQKPADGTRVLVLKKPFGTPEEADRILGELSGPDGPFTNLHLVQSRKFGDIRTTLTGSAGLENVNGLSDSAITELLGGKQPLASITGPLADQFSITLQVTFPGKASTATDVVVPIGKPAAAFDLRVRELDARAQAARRNTWIAFVLAGLATAALGWLAWRRFQQRRW
jgi:hypothetical protein